MKISRLNMRRTKEEAELTKKMVISSAIKTFIEKGYNATTIQDVADVAGVTRGAVYHYFENKIELFKEIRRNNNQIMNSIISKHIDNNGKNIETLRSVFIEFFERFESDLEFKEIHELVFKTEVSGYFRNDKDFGTEFREDLKISVSHIIDVIRYELKAGNLRDDIKPVSTAWSFIGLYFGIANLWLINNNIFSIKRKGKILIDDLIKGLKK